MGIMMLAWIIFAVVIGLVAVQTVATRLPRPSGTDQDRRLAEQAEQIEQLEDELRRVKEQADFTEKLLSERHDAPDANAPENGSRD